MAGLSEFFSSDASQLEVPLLIPVNDLGPGVERYPPNSGGEVGITEEKFTEKHATPGTSSDQTNRSSYGLFPRSSIYSKSPAHQDCWVFRLF